MWNEFMQGEESQEYYKKLMERVEEEYKQYTIFPDKENIFKAFEETHFENMKCVILGQDPYHELGQAMGLAFSVRNGQKIPPSLRNIFKELYSEYGEQRTTTDLTDWAQQGVLLLNTILTVREGEAGSHKNIGWGIFTDHVLQYLNESDSPIAFMLWGNFAIQKAELITNPKHLILTAAHPSPLSANRGFFGCDHFKKCNEFLEKNGKIAIHWMG